MRVGLAQQPTPPTGGAAPLRAAVDVPADTVWYTLAYAEASEGYPLTLSAPDAQGNYAAALTVFLCREDGPLAYPPSADGMVALLLALVGSGALGAAGLALRKPEQRRYRALCLHGALWVLVGGLLVSGAYGVSASPAAAGDVGRLPACEGEPDGLSVSATDIPNTSTLTPFVVTSTSLSPAPEVCTGVITASDGVRLHESASYESPFVFLPLGVRHKATVELRSRVISNDGVWYYVLHTDRDPINSLSRNREGWVPRELLDIPPDEECLVPWEREPMCPNGGVLQGVVCHYTYSAEERRMSAAYAIAYAGIPPAPQQFAVHHYAGVNTGGTNNLHNTDCTNFVSQALWYGGLPMTRDWLCSPMRGNCEAFPCPCRGQLGHSGGSAWTSADNTSGLPAYIRSLYSNGESAIMSAAPPIALAPDYVALGVTYADLFEDQDLSALVMIDQVLQAGRRMGNLGIEVGDLVSVSDPPHVMLVVGWGPLLLSWEEIRVWHERSGVLGDVYGECSAPERTNPCHHVVPYIVDHGPQGAVQMTINGNIVTDKERIYSADNDTVTQITLICPECVRPRPYYAIYWNGPNGQPDGFPRSAAFVFTHIPSSLDFDVFTIIQDPPVTRETIQLPMNTVNH